MAKHKRKISSTQRDKEVIRVAKKLKESGILSKKANLHSGHYVSKGVLKKVKEYQFLARNNYRAVPATKADVSKAKAAGFVTIGGTKIVGPNTPTFRARVKRHDLVTGIAPVKGGYMEEVIMPHDIWDIRRMISQSTIEEIDALKLPEEYFAFTYHGNYSRGAFHSTEAMIEHLMHYKGLGDYSGSVKPEEMQEEFKALTFFRLHRNDIAMNIPGKEARKKMKGKGPYSAEARGRRTPYSEYQLKKHQERKKKRLERMKENDPKAYAARKEKERLRVKAYRDRIKSGK